MAPLASSLQRNPQDEFRYSSPARSAALPVRSSPESQAS